MPGVKLVGNLTTGVVLLYGGYRVLHGEMTIGTLAAFLLYLRMFFEPMQEISQFFNTFQSASSALEKLAGVLGRAAGHRRSGRPGARWHTVRGEIDFDDVEFAYVAGPTGAAGPGPRRCPPGQTVALVGTTGRGQDDDRQADRPVLRPDVGIGDARRRRPARPDAGRPAPPRRDGDPGELHVRRHGRRQHPVRPARRHRRRDPRRGRGGRRGHASSTRCPTATTPTSPSAAAGCRRVSGSWSRSPGRSSPIPAVLILDEATSSLDIPSERMVQRALETVLADRTAVVIAHRLSTVRDRRPGAGARARPHRRGRPAGRAHRRGDGRYAALHRAWVRVAGLTRGQGMSRAAGPC